MLLSPVLQRFVEQAPLSVLARSLLERAADPVSLDRLFQDHARDERTRQLLFSAVVDRLPLAVDLVPCAAAYARERARPGPVLDTVAAGQLWVADRNFCTTGVVFGVAARGGAVLVRRHRQTLTWAAETPWADAGPGPGGRLQE